MRNKKLKPPRLSKGSEYDQRDIIYSNGFEAGNEALEVVCPYEQGSEEKAIWDQGHDDGVLAYFKSIKNAGRKIKDAIENAPY